MNWYYWDEIENEGPGNQRRVKAPDSHIAETMV